MKAIPAVIVRVEEIMTPRAILTTVTASDVADARRLSEEGDFDVIPVVRNGYIREFWRRRTRRMHPITDRHRVQYNEGVAAILPRLAKRLTQFVCYGPEVVGLVDVSDLNKPIARLIWLHPLLEVEQAIFMEVRARKITDEEIRKALGSPTKEAERRRRKAKKEELGFPLLEFVQFRHVLKLGKDFGIASLSPEEIDRLNSLRRRSAHGVARPIEKYAYPVDSELHYI